MAIPRRIDGGEHAAVVPEVVGFVPEGAAEFQSRAELERKVDDVVALRNGHSLSFKMKYYSDHSALCSFGSLPIRHYTH